MEQAAYTSLAPWFGAKRTMAPKIIELIGDHRAYWEPFCGSMAVILNKPPAPMETVNDLHRDLMNLARVVRDEDASQRLHWRLRRTIPAESLFRESLAAMLAADAPPVDSLPSVDRAYHYFLTSWLGMNGVSGTARTTASFAKRFSSQGGAPGVRFAGAVDSLPWWHERLRSVVVLQGDGIGLCERIEDREGTAIYVDPPYFAKQCMYKHDFTPADHERLSTALSRFKATRVVLSYYHHPEVDRLYAGWQKLEVAATKAMVNAGKRTAGKTAAPEVLLTNWRPE